jgi:PIN domain nuclease of toxin-antitoxin system
MKAVVLDTHAIIWYFLASPKLSKNAIQAIEKAKKIYISAISVVEIIYLQEKGKIPQEALQRLYQVLADSNNNWFVISCDFEIAKSLSQIDRETVPEMPDRIISATALYLNLPLITRDTKISASLVKTIW